MNKMENKYRYDSPRKDIEKTRKYLSKETAELANQIEDVYLKIVNSDLTKPSILEISSDMSNIRRINHMLNGLGYLDRTSPEYARAQDRIDVSFDKLSREYLNRIIRRKIKWQKI